MTTRYHFVHARWNGPGRAISCDGLVPGADLHLSHWEGNRTPERFKRDTSTETALTFVASGAAREWADAALVNNHFDTDGVLTVFTLLDPERALAHRSLLVAAAEAGDFDEWPSDRRGVWLDSALRTLADRCRSEEEASHRCLEAVPELLDHVEERSDLWSAEWMEIQRARRDVETDRVHMRRIGSLGLVVHPSGREEIPGVVVTRVLPNCRRYLYAFERGDGRYAYRYELPRYAWADVVGRAPISPPDTLRLTERLGPEWSAVGLPLHTGLVRTVRPVRTRPEAAATNLLGLDEGLAIPVLRA